MIKNRLSLLVLTLLFVFIAANPSFAQSPFEGPRGKNLDSACWDNIWDTKPAAANKKNKKWAKNNFLKKFVKVPRDQVVCFALYTQQNKTVKMTAQLFPLKKDESREVRLELKQNGEWKQIQTAEVAYPGWHTHFQINNWDDTKDVAYRVRHGEKAMFKGLIRKSITDKDEIVVGNLSCNSSNDRGNRDNIVKNLKLQNPDLIFFAGDQSYDHSQHTAAWLLFGTQFREIIKDRPTITIPDDHDVGQANIWGESGKVAKTSAGPSGGYFYPAKYVKMVEDAQTWHLPDAVDPKPIGQGIGVYFTNLKLGGIDFAILEDRKFKSGPEGKIPQMGPRPDHINSPGYDPKKIDLPELKLLGDRQLQFLNDWGQNWNSTKMKVVLSQTAFCGAVHLHGKRDDRLLADLDCNGWPQRGRNKALIEMRKARATHLCGDQHLAVVVKHGIKEFRDGPFAFTSPAIVNTIYGRWWWPEDEKAGAGKTIKSALPWTGDFLDGLYNKITMYAYANPNFATMTEGKKMQKEGKKLDLADGFGIARFNTKTHEVVFECWPRLCDASKGDSEQYAGWPIKFKMEENDGRQVHGFLPKLKFNGFQNPVVQVIDESNGDVVYTQRVLGSEFQPQVYEDGIYTVRVGMNDTNGFETTGLKILDSGDHKSILVELKK